MVYNATQKQHFVAVYGSLRKGMGNHHVNDSGGGEYMFKGKTFKDVDMFEYCSGFPSVAITKGVSKTPVTVEIYRVPESGLHGSYDQLEGYNRYDPERSFYKRTLVPIVLDDTGDMVNAWIYHIEEETGDVVASGDWVAHKLPKEEADELVY